MKKIQIKNAVVGLMLMLVSAVSSTLAVAANVEQLAQTCAICHGANGVSISPVWPNLAGQNEMYLAEQIKAFRDGVRKDPSMLPMVQSLSDQQADDLAAYFSKMKAPVASEPANQAGRHVSGRCISCHGMEGKTVNSQWPNISGQKKEYLQKQLTAFRGGTRHSDVMKVIVEKFTDQQIADVAEFYGQ